MGSAEALPPALDSLTLTPATGTVSPPDPTMRPLRRNRRRDNLRPCLSRPTPRNLPRIRTSSCGTNRLGRRRGLKASTCRSSNSILRWRLGSGLRNTIRQSSSPMNCATRGESRMLELIRLLRTLVEADVDFVLVGGLAAVVHGATLRTRDSDVCCRFFPTICFAFRTPCFLWIPNIE